VALGGWRLWLGVIKSSRGWVVWTTGGHFAREVTRLSQVELVPGLLDHSAASTIRLPGCGVVWTGEVAVHCGLPGV
jgi:hypothetical protein